jgi:hypothetical protein
VAGGQNLMLASAFMKMAESNYDAERAEKIQRLAVKLAPVAWQMISPHGEIQSRSEIPTQNAPRVACLAVYMAKEIILQSREMGNS